MGARMQYLTMMACSIGQLERLFAQKQKALNREHGSDLYAGHMGLARGLDVVNDVFDDIDNAKEYLIEHCSKWGSALALRVKNAGNVQSTEQGKEFDYWFIGACVPT